MDARALRYFQAVVEFGSYSRAAEFLRISQPAISRQVDRLEAGARQAAVRAQQSRRHPDRCGAPAVRAPASRSCASSRTAKAEIKSAAGASTGTIVIALPPGVGHYLLPPLVRALSRGVSEHIVEDILRLQRLYS